MYQNELKRGGTRTWFMWFTFEMETYILGRGDVPSLNPIWPNQEYILESLCLQKLSYLQAILSSFFSRQTDRLTKALNTVFYQLRKHSSTPQSNSNTKAFFLISPNYNCLFIQVLLQGPWIISELGELVCWLGNIV